MHSKTFMEQKALDCFSETVFELTDLQCTNGTTCIVYWKMQLESFRLKINDIIDEGNLQKDARHEVLAHLMCVMIVSKV